MLRTDKKGFFYAKIYQIGTETKIPPSGNKQPLPACW